MNSILHEIGWRSAIYCLFVGGVSLFSLSILIRQTVNERQSRIQAELNLAMRAEEDDADPIDVLNISPSRPPSLLSRYLLIAAHTMVIAASLFFGLHDMKSALYAHQANNSFAEHDYDNAVKRYDSALASSPYAEYLMKQYQASLAQSDLKGGDLGDMRRLVGLHPGNEGNHNDLGNVLMQHGDMAGAIKEYQQAVALKPDDPIVHNNLGNALQAAHRYPESITELRRAIQLDPNQIPTYYNLANTLMANDQTEEAVKYYHTALEKNPKLAPAYYNLAQALAKLGKQDQAMTTMDTFLQLAPKQPEFAGAVAKAKQQLTDWRSAH